MEVTKGQNGSQQRKNILFIRHGTTAWNVEKKYLGHTDIALLPDTERELDSLREQLSNVSWDAVYCSNLLRCQQTLAMTGPHLLGHVKLDPRLREVDFGQWEGMTYVQLKDNQQYRDWIDAPQDITPPEGESWQAFTARIDSFLQEYIWSDGSSMFSPESGVPTIIVVTHGGVIRYALSRLIADLGFWDTQVIPGQAIQVRLEQHGDQWAGERVTFPAIGL
ncbi:histidine phosphatase family protein [Paenibacillus sp. SZ31]|uniref:histidine phosphatase family protein n=1 Tax=Paenibacillus sp. SZ31 TaxID=2725555 RepID=UPI00146F4650|nr:histidine phosphatase family protein [Paenibacillus sp. SZ31]NMI03259.1 histidine phosphatase family protein [Paenibacillus sp. SZ31]